MKASKRPSRAVLGASDELEALLVDTARAVSSSVDGVDGAGVTMLLGGGLTYGCANDFATRVDAVQYGSGQGPCIEAAASGVVVRSGTLGQAEERWPEFTRGASPLALRSVVSVPLLASGAVIGSLNLYSRQQHGLEDLDDTAAREVGERVMPTVRNARLIAISASNSLLLRASSSTRAPR